MSMLIKISVAENFPNKAGNLTLEKRKQFWNLVSAVNLSSEHKYSKI